jgi:FtsZ-binding cell division protein ZapB
MTVDDAKKFVEKISEFRNLTPVESSDTVYRGSGIKFSIIHDSDNADSKPPFPCYLWLRCYTLDDLKNYYERLIKNIHAHSLFESAKVLGYSVCGDMNHYMLHVNTDPTYYQLFETAVNILNEKVAKAEGTLQESVAETSALRKKNRGLKKEVKYWETRYQKLYDKRKK